MMRNPNLGSRVMLPFLAIVLVASACVCFSPTMCVVFPGGDMAECEQYIQDGCGDLDATSKVIIEAGQTGECMYYMSQSSGGGACTDFRLTSPLDGLAFGENTFYWDPYPGATSYRIKVFGDGQLRATYDIPGSQTNYTNNLSSGFIGEGSAFLIRIEALVGPGVICSDEHLLTRAAQIIPSNPIVVTPLPPPTATPFRLR